MDGTSLSETPRRSHNNGAVENMPSRNTIRHRRRYGQEVIIGISIALIITSLLMVVLVLLHKGKGGGLSDLFGGGMSSSLGSSSVVERNLDRITVVIGVAWFICIVVLSFLFNR
jgi:preprotein translocase subunit SecG